MAIEVKKEQLVNPSVLVFDRKLINPLAQRHIVDLLKRVKFYAFVQGDSLPPDYPLKEAYGECDIIWSSNEANV